MTDITIYKVDGNPLIVAPITKDATIKKVLMGDWYIEIPFTHTAEIPIPKGCYIEYDNQKFEIMDNVYPEHQSTTGGYKYSLKFWAQQNHFKRCKVFYGRCVSFANRMANELARIANGDIRGAYIQVGVSSEVTFHNTATLRDFAELIISNIQYFTSSRKWCVGNIPNELDIEANPETARRENISFDGTSCWDAVNLISEAFEVEWWTNINATTGEVYLNFGTCKFNTPINFKKGEIVNSIPAKKGDTSEYGTRFFVYGGTQNLAPNYRRLGNEGGTTNHISEKRLCMRDDDGNYVDYIDARPNLTPSEVIEQVVKFDDIFPKSEETITEVSTVDRMLNVNGESKTFKAYVVTCKDTAYTDDLLMKNETLGCVFTSGYLNGREFELSTDRVGDKQFEIIHTTETDGNGGTIILPGGTIVDVDGTITEQDVFRPRGVEYDEFGKVTYKGDTFILTGISLPEENVIKAEQELYRKGLEYAEKNSSDTDVYDCPTNPVYCTENDCNYNVGQAVKLYSTRFKNGYRESRIQGYSKKLYNEYIATYTIGDNASYSLISAVAKQIESSEISSKEYADEIVKKANRTSNRKYTDVKQTAKSLAQANLDYFSESLNPISVQTMQMIVGDDSLQFDLKFDDENVGIYYSKATGKIVAGSAILYHYTVGIENDDATLTFDTGYRQIWKISNVFGAVPEEPNKPYWLYVKAAKKPDNSGSFSGEYILSEKSIRRDEDENYYYFLVGLLNAENYDGDRAWTTMYGFTEITPNRIATKKIQSNDGGSWLDLETGAASFAGGKISWDSEGNTDIRDLKAHNIVANDSKFHNVVANDCEFNDVTVKGSIASPFPKESTFGWNLYIVAKTYIGTGNEELAAIRLTRAKDKDTGSGEFLILYAWYAIERGCRDYYYTIKEKPQYNDELFSILEEEPKASEYVVYKLENPLSSEDRVIKTDNICILNAVLPEDEGTDIIYSDDTFEWDSSNNGRIIRIVNAHNSEPSKGNAILSAPEGKYFYENGEKFSHLVLGNTIVELLGWGKGTEFYGWIVLNRSYCLSNNLYGAPMNVVWGTVVNLLSQREYHSGEGANAVYKTAYYMGLKIGDVGRIWNPLLGYGYSTEYAPDFYYPNDKFATGPFIISIKAAKGSRFDEFLSDTSKYIILCPSGTYCNKVEYIKDDISDKTNRLNVHLYFYRDVYMSGVKGSLQLVSIADWNKY